MLADSSLSATTLSVTKLFRFLISVLSGYIWAVTCDFQQCGILTSVDSYEPVQPPFKLRNSKWCSVSSFTVIDYSSNFKGSDQTARMRRLIWGFAGRTYHIVGNLMLRLICYFIGFVIQLFISEHMTNNLLIPISLPTMYDANKGLGLSLY